MLSGLPFVAALHFEMIALCRPHILWLQCGLVYLIYQGLCWRKKLRTKVCYDGFFPHATFQSY